MIRQIRIHMRVIANISLTCPGQLVPSNGCRAQVDVAQSGHTPLLRLIFAGAGGCGLLQASKTHDGAGQKSKVDVNVLSTSLDAESCVRSCVFYIVPVAEFEEVKKKRRVSACHWQR